MSGVVRFGGRQGVLGRKSDRERLLFIGAALMAFSLAVFTLIILNQGQDASAKEAIPTAAAPVTIGHVTLWVPEQDIAAGTKLSQVNFREVYWPKAQVPDGAVRDLAELRAMFAKTTITAGMPMVKDFLTDQAVRTSLALTKGYRAVSIEVDATGSLEGYALPGTRQDIVLTYMKENELTSKVIVENVRVLSYGGSDKTLDERQQNSLEDAVKVSSTITLEVLPEDALKIQTARQMGRLSLMMRAAGEESKTVGGSREWSQKEFDGSLKKSKPEPAGCSRGTMRVEGEEFVVDCDGSLNRVMSPE